MSNFKFLLAALLFLSSSARAQGEETVVGGTTQANQDAALPTGGDSLLPPDALAALLLAGKAADGATLQLVPTEGQPFTRALRITTRVKSGEGDIVLSAPTASGFKEVDTLFIRLYLRTLQSEAPDGFGSVGVNIEPNTAAPRALYRGTARAKAGAGWVRYDSPAMAMRGYEAGKSRLEVRVGGSPQEIEIGGIEVLNYERRRFPHQLPHRSGGSYAGRENHAPWRREAAARIEKHRKADLQIAVRDKAGRPLPNARIEVKMTRHHYPFGTAVSESFFANSAGTPDNQKYRAALKKYFNHAVLEGGHKMRSWQSSAKNRDNTVQTTAWLRENGLVVRGHALVWPGWTNLPNEVKPRYEKIKTEQGEEAAKTFLRATIRDHIGEIARAFKGQLSDWDVINETTTNHALMDILGEDEMVQWFKIAREVEPEIPLYLNEFNNLTAGQKNTDNFERTIRLLLEKGAPLGGLGFQAHGGALSIPEVEKNLERFARFGLPMKITEFDIVTPDEKLQADWTRDLMTLFFSHRQSAGFLMWGFWDGKHWLGDAPMFYPDWTLKPSGQAYEKLVFGDWWTRAQGRTNARGQYQTRGFLGDYQITVALGGKTKTVGMALTRSGGSLAVILE